MLLEISHYLFKFIRIRQSYSHNRFRKGIHIILYSVWHTYSAIIIRYTSSTDDIVETNISQSIIFIFQSFDTRIEWVWTLAQILSVSSFNILH